ncbi:MAG: general secretion pathway protein GspB [Gammaproteobacteria bacterium]|nr:general secretion pathway protein GspB [Gammaproteobacteria bacterium]
MCERTSVRRIRRSALAVAAMWATVAGPVGADLTDPTRPPTPSRAPNETAPAQSFHLSSTLIAPGRRVAVINGERVGVGERVDGARVLAIENGRVQLRYRGERRSLSLAAGDIKQPAAAKADQ